MGWRAHGRLTGAVPEVGGSSTGTPPATTNPHPQPPRQQVKTGTSFDWKRNRRCYQWRLSPLGDAHELKKQLKHHLQNALQAEQLRLAQLQAQGNFKPRPIQFYN